MTGNSWSDRVIILPRWVLQVQYGLFVILAGLTVIRGLVTLDLTTPDTYTPIWSAAVAIGAAVAFVGSLRARWCRAEKWAATWVASWLAVILINSIILGNGAGWLLIVIVTALPAGRAVALFTEKRP